MPEPSPHQPSAAPQQVVGKAIQDLTATRLGRGFIPLSLLFLGGTGELLMADGGLLLPGGALATGLAMLAYGLRVVQAAFGREPRMWMKAAMLGSVVPPLYALYVLAWRGLRGIAVGGGAGPVLAAILLTAIGVWVLRSWMKVVEVERLARVMNMNLDGEGGPA